MALQVNYGGYIKGKTSHMLFEITITKANGKNLIILWIKLLNYILNSVKFILDYISF